MHKVGLGRGRVGIKGCFNINVLLTRRATYKKSPKRIGNKTKLCFGHISTSLQRSWVFLSNPKMKADIKITLEMSSQIFDWKSPPSAI